MIISQIIFISIFILFIFADSVIRSLPSENGSFSKKLKDSYFKFISLNYFTIFISLFVLITIIFCILSLFYPSLFPTTEIKFDINIEPHSVFGQGNSQNANPNDISGKGVVGNINVNNPLALGRLNTNVNISVAVPGLNSVAGAMAACGGVAGAAKVVQKFPGPPIVKAAVGAGTIILTGGTAALVGKFLKPSESSDNSKNLIMDLDFNSKNPEKYTDYPLNLLTDLDSIINAELFFLFALFYIYIVKGIINYFLANLDTKKYFNFTNSSLFFYKNKKEEG